MAVVCKILGHLRPTNYRRSQHRTQGVLLLVMLISRANPLGNDEKAVTVLNKLKELNLKKTGSTISTLNCSMTLNQFRLDVNPLLLQIKHLLEELS